MSSHREGVNPLRPYYIPPTIGDPSEPISNAGAQSFSRGNATAAGRYAATARDIFSDLDYKEYLGEPSPSVLQTAKDLVDELLWKYTSVLMAQPFEVAKTLLQVRSQEEPTSKPSLSTAGSDRGHSKQQSLRSPIAEYQDSDSEHDEPTYFTSNVSDFSATQRRGQPSRRIHDSPPDSPIQSPKRTPPAHQLLLTRPESVLDVIGQLWQKEGAFGVWKGSNATFIYNVLQSLLENFSRSCLSALFNVPDLGVKDDIDRLVDIASPYPWASFFVAAAAAIATGLALAPLDLVRTR
jgi:mitochondrial fusion and transport protein UGO1